MTSLLFCVVALVLFAYGYSLVKKGSARTRQGGDAFTKSRRRKTIGQTLFAVAGLLVVLAAVRLTFSGEFATVDVAEPGGVASKTGAAAPPSLRPPTNASTDLASASSVSPHRLENVFSSTPAGPGISPKVQNIFSSPAPPAASTPAPAPEPSPEPVPAATPSALVRSLSPPPPPDLGPPPPTTPTPIVPPTYFVDQPLADARKKELDAALARSNEALQHSPSDVTEYERRGNIYGQQKQWDLAVKDYKRALELDSKSTPAMFNLAEVEFLQKNYDAARAGFAALQKDPELGDLASYKVFLCDLVGGHVDVAARELDAFNQVGSNASYYFANVAWSAAHEKTDETRDWLRSGLDIYSPTKVRQYTTSLIDLGYLPNNPN
jgi:hypothetical protein